ncbi:MAG: hypothetical protein IJR28_06395 [Ottowia sp.]|nr:hypothetical protein [Ottowia sp.]
MDANAKQHIPLDIAFHRQQTLLATPYIPNQYSCATAQKNGAPGASGARRFSRGLLALYAGAVSLCV